MLPFNHPCEISWHQHVFGCPRPGQLPASCLLPGWRVITRCDESWQCSWHRVTCHGRHVTTVTLSPRWLSGPIWPGYQAPCLIECDTQGPDVTTGITPHRMSDNSDNTTRASQSPRVRNKARTQRAGLNLIIFTASKLNWAILSS